MSAASPANERGEKLALSGISKSAGNDDGHQWRSYRYLTSCARFNRKRRMRLNEAAVVLCRRIKARHLSPSIENMSIIASQKRRARRIVVRFVAVSMLAWLAKINLMLRWRISKPVSSTLAENNRRAYLSGRGVKCRSCALFIEAKSSNIGELRASAASIRPDRRRDRREMRRQARRGAAT